MGKREGFEDDVNMATVRSQAGYRLILSVAARTSRGVVSGQTTSAATTLLTSAGRFAWPRDGRRRGRHTVITLPCRVQLRVQFQTGTLERVVGSLDSGGEPLLARATFRLHYQWGNDVRTVIDLLLLARTPIQDSFIMSPH